MEIEAMQELHHALERKILEDIQGFTTLTGVSVSRVTVDSITTTNFPDKRRRTYPLKVMVEVAL